MNIRTKFLFLPLGVIAAFGSSSGVAQTWTSTSDFEQGVFVNLNATTDADQLQINTWTETKTSDPPVLPYL